MKIGATTRAVVYDAMYELTLYVSANSEFNEQLTCMDTSMGTFYLTN